VLPTVALAGWTMNARRSATDGMTVTVSVWATPVPSIAPETTLAPTAVERSVPVATPLMSVAPAGWVSVLPEPVAESTTEAPGTRFPWSSRAVTVIVEMLEPLLAAMLAGDACSVDCAAEISPGTTRIVS